MGCVPMEILLAFVRGEASDESRHEVAGHLSTGCMTCRKAEDWIRTTLDVTAQDQSVPVGEDQVRWAVAQFRARPVAPGLSVREFIAGLIFDSFSAPELAGARGERSSVGSGRQMLFRTEGYDVDVRIGESARSEPDSLIGQILPTGGKAVGASAIEIRLVCDGEELASTRTDAQGIFRFGKVCAGNFDLCVVVPEGILRIPYVAPRHES